MELEIVSIVLGHRVFLPHGASKALASMRACLRS